MGGRYGRGMMGIRQTQYRDHTIETIMVSGAGLWSVSVFRNADKHTADKHTVWFDGGYSRRAAAVRDARYVIDNAIKDAEEAG